MVYWFVCFWCVQLSIVHYKSFFEVKSCLLDGVEVEWPINSETTYTGKHHTYSVGEVVLLCCLIDGMSGDQSANILANGHAHYMSKAAAHAALVSCNCKATVVVEQVLVPRMHQSRRLCSVRGLVVVWHLGPAL